MLTIIIKETKRKPIKMSLLFVKLCITGLHNYVTTAINGEGQSRNQRMSDTYSGLHPVGQMSSNHYDIIAKNTRIKLTDYFAGEGSVPFQYLNI